MLGSQAYRLHFITFVFIAFVPKYQSTIFNHSVMKRFILAALAAFSLVFLFAAAAPLSAQSVVINKYFNAGSSGASAGDALELLVIQNNLDLRGMIVKDFTGNMSADNGGKFTFTSNALWSSVQAGTLITLRNDASASDTVAGGGDYTLDLGLKNAAYFTASNAAGFDIEPSDMVMIKSAGSDTAGVANSIHLFASGSAGLLFADAALPKLLAGTATTDARFAFAKNSGSTLANFSGTDAQGNTAGLLFGVGNNATNTAYITSLRPTAANPEITVKINGADVPDGGAFAFQATPVGATTSATVTVTNVGGSLLSVSAASVTGAGLNQSGFTAASLAQSQSATFTLNFAPNANQAFTGALAVTNSDADETEYNISLSGAVSTPITIAAARALPLGSTVTVAGRVTVANEFAGPVYFQDATGGMGVFYTPLHTAVLIGDSIIVSGKTTEFQPTAGVTGSGFFQIAEVGGSTVTFNVITGEPAPPAPKVRTIAQILSAGESIEGQLVTIQAATITTTLLQPNTTYNGGIIDASSSMNLRIDAEAPVSGATVPSGARDITGVISHFRNEYQILPRILSDVPGATKILLPGEGVPKSQTFDVCTWNIEWLGSTANGPTDEALQQANAKTVLQTIDADLYGLEEITTQDALNAVTPAGYANLIAPISQTQKTAFIYKTSTITPVSNGFLFNTGDWASGRYPFEFVFDATIQGNTKRINAVVVHGKAQFDNPPDDYARRVADSQQLKTFLDANRAAANVLFIGDYNDDVDVSIYAGQASPYANFVGDAANYRVITKRLSELGFASQTSGQMIDHITMSNELYAAYFDSTERVENPSYIPSYLSTTSDHYPIWTRFDFSRLSVKGGEPRPPVAARLLQNYPNPFNPETNINYDLGTAAEVSLKVFDVLGREVASLVNAKQAAGNYRVRFNAAGLSSGVYFYKLVTGSFAETKKMTIIK